MFPPMLMYLRIDPPDRRRIGLWLPLLLVWLILLPIVVLILALTLVADAALILAGQRYHHYTLLLFRCLEVLSATRGTVVRIDSDKAAIDVEFV